MLLIAAVLINLLALVELFSSQKGREWFVSIFVLEAIAIVVWVVLGLRRKDQGNTH